jgi:nucleotide-binding universal stress UspA family protein
LSTSRILVAVSSPWASQKLTEPIVDLARRLDAEAVIAHVANLREEDESETDAKQRGEQTLKMLTKAMLDADIEAQGVMLFSDDIAKAIINTAKARECTLIVLGLSGKGMLKRLIGGDVPANIIRQCDIPVLLCPANWTGRL